MAPTISGRSTVVDNDGRKRVPKACDRCRLKKVKCDGNMPCPRCKMEDAVCHYGSRRKSIERSISTGYVEQLEIQQQILVKALKTLWSKYASDNAQGSLGKEPSIHAIVQNLEELGAPSSYKHLALDFIFNQDIKEEGSCNQMETTDPSPEPETRAVNSYDSSSQNKVRQSLSISTEAMSGSKSPTFSTASSRVLCHSLSPIDISSSPKISPTSGALPTPDSSTSASFKSNRPTFCMIPPRPNIAPVVPVPLSPDPQVVFGGSLQLSPALTEGLWQLTEGDWMNHDFGGDVTGMGVGFDQEMEGLVMRDDEAWVR